MKKLMENFRKYLNESEFSGVLSQVETNQYENLTPDVWETIQDEGYDEELELYNPEDFEYTVLSLPPEDTEPLKAYAEEALEKWNRFDIELKEKYKNHIDLIDYDNGIIKIVRVRQT